MNYIQHFLSKLGLNESEGSSCEDNSPNESGQFQVIEFDQDFINDNHHKQNDCRVNELIQSCEETFKNGSTHNPNQKDNSSVQKNQFYTQNQPGIDQQKPEIIQKPYEKNQQPYKQYPLVEANTQPSKGSASTIQLDEYYMIVSNEQLTKKFTTNQQWQAFYNKINNFNSQQVLSMTMNHSLGCSMGSGEKKRQKLSLNLTQLNSILEIQSHQLQKRTEYWNQIAKPPVNIKFKCTQLANKKDPKRLQQYVSKILTTLADSILCEIHDNKIKPISSVQDEIQKWKVYLIKLLTLYGANDKQIGYSKGLEYIALGILVAKPFSSQKSFESQYQSINHSHSVQTSQSQVQSPQLVSSQQGVYSELQTHFKYFLFTKQLRNMYFPGTPKLYQQIQLLTEQMATEVPQIISRLEQLKVDFVKLFINYYKTFLLYKIKNPEVIRKIMELLAIYGIDIVRIILTRIMNRNEKKILEITEQIELLRYLAESLVQSYFGPADSLQVIAKFKHLFILDSLT